MQIMKLLTKTTVALLLAATIGSLAAAKTQQEEVPLTARGKELHETYTQQLEALRAEAVAALPAIDEGKKSHFIELRTKWNGIPAITEGTKPADKKTIEETTAQVQSDLLAAAGALLADLAPVLSSEALDPKLMRIAILTHGTPRGLAEFAQQGPDEEKLLEKLFADEPLMRQILEAGGANGGEYGEAMPSAKRMSVLALASSA